MGVDRSDETYAQVSLGRRCDGVDDVRRAARDEIRRGAHHIKIMANGGISSPTDRITSDQFSEEEIAAIVDEANMANLYVVSHTYTARSVARAVRNGVRSIEHGNLLDEETVALMKRSRKLSDTDAFLLSCACRSGCGEWLSKRPNGQDQAGARFWASCSRTCLPRGRAHGLWYRSHRPDAFSTAARV